LCARVATLSCGHRAGGALIVVEILVPEDNSPGCAQLRDINGLVVARGQERTHSEYSALFDRSGFRLTR
jgi:hypothetical protein